METKKYEEALRKLKEKLWKEIQKLETPTSFGDEPGSDLGEKEQDEDEELENRGGAAGTLRGRLEDVEHALAKIDANDGTYGICEDCGKPIEAEILKIDPESRLCKQCKLDNK